MNITEVRVKLMRNRSDRLRAFCSITIDDDFVVHDLRVIEGRSGFFVAMPSRKLTDNCPRCGGKNELRAEYCNECGAKLDEGRADRKSEKVHVDVAHPINTECREQVQQRVLTAYQEELGDEEAEPEQEAPQQEVYEQEGADEEDYQDFADDLEEQTTTPESEEADEFELPAFDDEDEAELMPLGEPATEILEKEEGLPNLIESVLAEQEASPAEEPELAGEEEGPPPVVSEEAPSEAPPEPEGAQQEAAAEQGEEEDADTYRRRSSKSEETSGGFGEGIL